MNHVIRANESSKKPTVSTTRWIGGLIALIVSTLVNAQPVQKTQASQYAACMSDAYSQRDVAAQNHGAQYVRGVRSLHTASTSPGHFQYQCQYELDLYHNGNFRWFTTWTGGYSTNAPDPLKSSGCTGGDSAGQCPLLVGNPVNVATGGKYQVEFDIPGDYDALSFARYFNGDKATRPDTALAQGWRSTYERRIELLDSVDSATAVAYRHDGKGFYFSASAGNWVADPDVKFSLIQLQQDGEFSGWRLTDAQDTQEIYDADGTLIQINFRNGKHQALTYLNGQLDRVTDQNGRYLAFSYDLSSRLVSVTNTDGSVVSFSYDADGNLSQVSYPGSATKQYKYDEVGYVDAAAPAAHALTGIYDESTARYGSFYYDANGRVLVTTHAGNADRVEIDYSTGGSSIITDSLGRTTTRFFGVANRAERFISASGPSSVDGNQRSGVSYDTNGYLNVSTDFAGVTTDYDYNTRGLLTQRIDASNDTMGRKRTSQTDWHPVFRVPIESRTYDASSALVSKSIWTYNIRGQALTSTRIDPTTNATRTVTNTYCEQADVTAGTCPLIGLTTSVDGPLNGAADTTTYTYYPTDDASCATSPTTCPHRKGDLWKVTNALGQVTETLRYDGAGRVLSVKDPNGVITDFEYHPRGWLTARKTRGADDASEADDQITRIEYWPTGLVKQVTQPDGAFTAYTYDAAHRLTDITDNAGNQIHYVLDNAGNRIKEDTKDANGNLKRTLSRVYNQLGQLTTQADAQANPTDFTYDANGNTDTITDALGRVTDNDYDPLNRLARTLQDLGGIAAETKFQYDALDNLTQVTDPKGLDTTYTYNGLGDLTQLQSPDTGTTTYTYDSAGNRTTQTDARGVTAQYDYDALNRLTRIVYPDAALNIAYTYDTVPTVCEAGESFAIGRLSAMADSSGATQYCYDRFGNTVRKVQTTNGVTFVLRYAYTLAGQLQAMVYPDGTTVDYARDAQGRITEVGVARTGNPREVLLHQARYHPFGPVAGWSYGNGRQMTRSLDQDYRPLAVQDPGTGGLSLNFGFDPVGALTQLTSGSPPPLSFVYDPLGRLTETRDGPTQAAIDTYSYDKTGNRTAHITAAGTRSYSYPTNSHRLTDVGGVIRAYDAAGNTLKIGTAKEFVYNDANRMGQVKQAGAVAMNYAYNGRGEQVRKHLGTNNTYTLYDEAGHWLGDYDSTGATLQQALWMDDLPVGLLANDNQLHYIEPDHLGTPRVAIEVTRDVPVWTWDVKGEAFGNTAPDQNPDGDAYAFVFDMRFPGQRYDAASGLNQNGFREYESIGRYTQSDPIGLNGGLNTYRYAYASPLVYLDPTGLSSCRTLFCLPAVVQEKLVSSSVTNVSAWELENVHVQPVPPPPVPPTSIGGKLPVGVWLTGKHLATCLIGRTKSYTDLYARYSQQVCLQACTDGNCGNPRAQWVTKESTIDEFERTRKEKEMADQIIAPTHFPELKCLEIVGGLR